MDIRRLQYPHWAVSFFFLGINYTSDWAISSVSGVSSKQRTAISSALSGRKVGRRGTPFSSSRSLLFSWRPSVPNLAWGGLCVQRPVQGIEVGHRKWEGGQNGWRHISTLLPPNVRSFLRPSCRSAEWQTTAFPGPQLVIPGHMSKKWYQALWLCFPLLLGLDYMWEVKLASCTLVPSLRIFQILISYWYFISFFHFLNLRRDPN